MWARTQSLKVLAGFGGDCQARLCLHQEARSEESPRDPGGTCSSHGRHEQGTWSGPCCHGAPDLLGERKTSRKGKVGNRQAGPGRKPRGLKGHSQSSGVKLQRGWGLSWVLKVERGFNHGEESQAFRQAVQRQGTENAFIPTSKAKTMLWSNDGGTKEYRRLSDWEQSVEPEYLRSNPSSATYHVTLVKVKVKSLSRIRVFATPWTLAYQAPPSMGFSRQEYWSGVPFPSPGDLSN